MKGAACLLRRHVKGFSNAGSRTYSMPCFLRALREKQNIFLNSQSEWAKVNGLKDVKPHISSRSTYGYEAVVLQSLKKGAMSQMPWTQRGFSSGHIDREGYRNFKRRGLDRFLQPGNGPKGGGGNNWEQLGTKRNVMVLGGVVVICGGSVLLYNANAQYVPYTHRRHVIFLSPDQERMLGETEFAKCKKSYKGNILPPFHPASVIVRRIAAKVIRAAEEGASAADWGQAESATWGPQGLLPPKSSTRLSKEKDTAFEGGWFGDEKEEEGQRSTSGHGEGLHNGLREAHLDEGRVHSKAEEGEFLREDSKWLDESRRKGLKERKEGFTKHLNGLKWEVLVVDDDQNNAFCLPGGKVVVFTGLLKTLPTEDNIATVLGHEVGHLVARHAAERISTGWILLLIQLLALQIVNIPVLVSSLSNLLVDRPFSRLQEMEADRIGLLIMAAAGYDPQTAPSVYEALSKANPSPNWQEFSSTHPSGDRRAKELRKAEVMREALNIYREKAASRGIEGFH